jgi:fermentation-respiration switch protein FrsA (DUF1100 family)
LKRS